MCQDPALGLIGDLIASSRFISLEEPAGGKARSSKVLSHFETERAQAHHEGGWELVFLKRIAGLVARWGLDLPGSFEGGKSGAGKEDHRKHLGPMRTDLQLQARPMCCSAKLEPEPVLNSHA